MPEEVVEKQESKISKAMSEMSTFCYNSDEGTVMGRNGGSWLKITGFYILFYSLLACFFGICLHVALMTIPEDRPKLVGRSNRPTISPARKIFRELDFTKSMVKYQEEVKAFIDEYDGINNNATGVKMLIGGNAQFDSCKPIDANYDANTACIFMNINRRFDWVPAATDLIACAWDVGLGGTGSLDPGFSQSVITPIINKTESAVYDLASFYPWSSKAVNGEQPVWAIKIARNVTYQEEEEEAFLKCSMRNGTSGLYYTAEEVSPYIFTVIYKPVKVE